MFYLGKHLSIFLNILHKLFQLKEDRVKDQKNIPCTKIKTDTRGRGNFNSSTWCIAAKGVTVWCI